MSSSQGSSRDLRVQSKYPTQYASFSEVEVKALFASHSWNNLSPQQRLDACQEMENRLAAERNTLAREVSAVPMSGSTYGFQCGNQITMNSHLLNDGVFVIEYKDFEGNVRTDVVSVNAPNWETLSTLYHEDLHGAWEDKGIMPQTYIEPGTSQELYVLQASEKAAFITEERETLSAIREVTQHTGAADPTAIDYLEAHKGSLYQESLATAQELYNDPHIEDTLNQYISDRDNGITPADPSSSYQKIDELYIQQTIRNYFENSKEGPAAEQTVRGSIDAQNTALANEQAVNQTVVPSILSGQSPSDDLETLQNAQEESAVEKDDVLPLEEDSQNKQESADPDGATISREGALNDFGASDMENDGASISAEGFGTSAESNDMDGATVSQEAALNDFGASDMENDGASISAEGFGTSAESNDMDGSGYDSASGGDYGYSNDNE